jgi:hypothetical protein
MGSQNKASNSMGQHTTSSCGKYQAIHISSLGGQPDIRERDKEFAAKDGYTKKELVD